MSSMSKPIIPIHVVNSMIVPQSLKDKNVKSSYIRGALHIRPNFISTQITMINNTAGREDQENNT